MKRNLWISLSLIGVLMGSTLGVVNLYGQTRYAPTPDRILPANSPMPMQPSNVQPSAVYTTPTYPAATPQRSINNPNLQVQNYSVYPGIPQFGVAGNVPDNQPMMDDECRQAIGKLQSPDTDDDEKQKAKATIRKHLKDVFDKDQKKRKAQISNLEEQIERLKKQLDKREESQTKLIDLRLELLENEGAGLAFPDAWRDLQSQSFGPMPAGGQHTSTWVGQPTSNNFSVPYPATLPGQNSLPIQSYPNNFYQNNSPPPYYPGTSTPKAAPPARSDNYRSKLRRELPDDLESENSGPRSSDEPGIPPTRQPVKVEDEFPSHDALPKPGKPASKR